MITKLNTVIILLLSMVSFAQTFTVDNLNYEVTATTPNEVQLTGGTPVSTNLEIPAIVSDGVNDYSVTAIRLDAFKNDDAITSVEIPASITIISNNAFRNIPSLTRVISNNTTAPVLGNNVFFNNSTACVLEVPEGSEDSYESAGWSNNFLAVNGVSVVGSQFIVDGFTYEVTGANPNTVQLRSGNNATGAITIPEEVTVDDFTFSVTAIRVDAFRDDVITSVEIPASVTAIGNNAFRDIPSLTTVISNNITAPVLGNSVFLNNGTTCVLEVPEGSEASYESAGWSNNFLAVNGVAAVGSQFIVDDFTYEVTGANPNTVQLRSGNNATGAITIPEEVTVGDFTFSVTAIRVEAFREDTITSVEIPASVTAIGNSAFRDTSLLTTIISNNTTAPVLGGNVFNNSNSTKVLEVPEGSEASYESAGWSNNFFAVNGVAVAGTQFIVDGFTYEVTGANPNTVQLISGNNATGAITISEEITANDFTFSVTAILAEAFREDVITSVEIPASVTAIGNAAFRDIPSLTAVISNNTTAPVLGNNVFLNSSTACVLEVPEGSEDSYESAGWSSIFFAVNGLAVIGTQFIVDGFTYEVTGANPNTVQLRSGNDATDAITIPEEVTANDFIFSVTAIRVDAFRDDVITSVEIPASVTAIGNNAFRNTSLLTKVISNNTTAPVLGAAVFLDSNNSAVVLEVPEGSEDSYEAAGWSSNFFTVNGVAVAGNQFVVEGFTYTVRTEDRTTVSLLSDNDATGAIVIPESITFNTLEFSVAALGGNAFTDNAGITSITSNSIVAPTLGNNTFSGIPENLNLTVPEGSEISYEAAGWSNFFTAINGERFVGNSFTVDGITYTITSREDLTISVSSSSITATTVQIPAIVFDTLSNTSYTVTGIGQSAFKGDIITDVSLPNTIATISADAFLSTTLVNVTIPDNVELIERFAFDQIATLEEITLGRNLSSIQAAAFDNSPLLKKITSLSANPAPIITGQNANAFGRREAEIDLFIPVGTTQIYLDAGWTDFKSYTEIAVDITVAPKVFLQGAFLNPNSGEETLMRDDLRVGNLLPTTSPYSDALTTTSVLATEGENAIVDWVFIELRDATDNTIVVEAQSALLQRDGDIVALDGVSDISFTEDIGDYFVSINHRNHLGIITASPISLSSTLTNLDFTTDASLIEGGTTALATLSPEIFGLYSGNFNQDSSISITDRNNVQAVLGERDIYTNADMDMNGVVQISEITNLVNTNLGNVQQFTTILQE